MKKLCAKRATDFQKVLAPPPSSNSHGTGGVGTPIESPTFSNRHQPRGRPDLAGKLCFPTEPFIDLLFMDNQASEVQPISMRKLQRVKLAWTISKPPRPPPIQLVATATILGTDLRRGYRWNRDSTAVLFRPTPASGAGIWPENHDFRRWFVRMPPELPAQISPPFLHQIDRAPGARQDFKRRPLRDRSSSDHLGDFVEFSAEV
ncbi:hypothetical protein Prudu_005915 [Prunus dulcis]|uniref:F-box family protein with DUF295 n=1 Tax=Prunus dulcis TaxID=3755 RepID=A0A4Y1QYT2_PRUDU|nr:hypothetical protein Prudu_005915 [Prunus dulcis]